MMMHFLQILFQAVEILILPGQFNYTLIFSMDSRVSLNHLLLTRFYKIPLRRSRLLPQNRVSAKSERKKSKSPIFFVFEAVDRLVVALSSALSFALVIQQMVRTASVFSLVCCLACISLVFQLIP